ncbi:MAG: NAD-dependent epimerase/dehydratase family protein [Fimbriimonadaceae bacterium]|nr:NAD-dependent epimerase/dehydratase family protein [Alphaproteobacteria bacterium]
MTSAKTLLITGATGFLGRHLITDFEKTGYKVRRALRLPDNRDGVVVGDINGTTDWREALVGIDAVIHLAGVAHRNLSYQKSHIERYQAVNVDGTLNLARQAQESKVSRFVFASSIGVHGVITNKADGAFSEISPLNPSSPYATSKVQAEDGLSRLASEYFAVAALRLPLIYGVDAPGNLGMLLRAIDGGWPLPLASVDNRRTFVGPALVSSFVDHWLRRPEAGFSPFLLAHAEQVSTPEFIRILADARGRSARLFPFPASVLKVALQLLGRENAAHGLFSSLELNIEKALSTGWQPPFSLQEGLSAAFGPAHKE